MFTYSVTVLNVVLKYNFTKKYPKKITQKFSIIYYETRKKNKITQNKYHTYFLVFNRYIHRDITHEVEKIKKA